MTPIQPLLALLAQTERQRDLALAELAKAQASHAAAMTQAEQLLAYRREYELRWNAQFSREGAIDVVRCYQSFMERLTVAVDSQARVTSQAGLKVERLRASAGQIERQVAAVRKLLERRSAEQRQLADRAAQKADDELAARMARGRGTAADHTHIA